MPQVGSPSVGHCDRVEPFLLPHTQWETGKNKKIGAQREHVALSHDFCFVKEHDTQSSYESRMSTRNNGRLSNRISRSLYSFKVQHPLIPQLHGRPCARPPLRGRTDPRTFRRQPGQAHQPPKDRDLHCHHRERGQLQHAFQ